MEFEKCAISWVFTDPVTMMQALQLPQLVERYIYGKAMLTSEEIMPAALAALSCYACLKALVST